MTTKMKGLFKGLRYISQIFEDEENEELDIQIGFPTDVKHVAHIGWDGPAAAPPPPDSNPTWMKDFKATNGQSAPLDSNGKNQDDSETKWVSEDSKKGNRAIQDSPGGDTPELVRSTRRNTSSDNNDHSPKKKKDSSTKTRHSRRNNSKDASELNPSDLASQDLAKKTRRKKSKDVDSGGSTRSRSKDTDGGGSTRSRSKPAPGHDAGSVLRTMDPVS